MNKLTLFLAGAMSATKGDFLETALTTDWRIESWHPDGDRADFDRLLPEADAVVGGNILGGWPDVPRLKLYQIPFAGYNWINPGDIPAGVTFCNTFEHEIPIAEYVMLAMLDWEIGYGAESSTFRSIGWNGIGAGEGPMHNEVFGKTVGIVGYGHIGREIAKRADAFGMRVIGLAQREREAPAPLAWLGTAGDLERLLAESDYVVIACPQNDDTLGLIDDAMFDRMKSEGVIINVARGPIIDEQALYAALSENRIGGAIIDVWYDYPERGSPAEWPSKLPFQELDNIRMTPHSSGWTHALQDRRWRFVAANLDRLARGEALQNVVFEGTG